MLQTRFNRTIRALFGAAAMCAGAFTGATSAAFAQVAATALPPVFHAMEQPRITALAKRTFAQMQSGKLDRDAFSPSARAALSDDQLVTAAQQLQALGTPTWSFVGEYHPPTNDTPVPKLYLLKFPAVALRLEIALDRAGKITNFFLSPSPQDDGAN